MDGRGRNGSIDAYYKRRSTSLHYVVRRDNSQWLVWAVTETVMSCQKCGLPAWLQHVTNIIDEISRTKSQEFRNEFPLPCSKRTLLNLNAMMLFVAELTDIVYIMYVYVDLIGQHGKISFWFNRNFTQRHY